MRAVDEDRPGQTAGCGRSLRGSLRGSLLLAAAILLAAWGPALGALVLTVVGDSAWDSISRMMVTALVYAPTAGIVLSIGQRSVAAVLTALACTSGLSSLTKAASALPGSPRLALIEVFEPAVVYAMHLSELAALGVLIWLLSRHPLRRVGVWLGCSAILLDAANSAAHLFGAAPSALQQLLPLLLALGSFLLGVTATLRLWWRDWQVERILPWFCAGALLLVASYLHLVPGVGGITMSVSAAAFMIAQSLLPTAILAAVFGGSGTIIDRRLVSGLTWAQSLGCGIGLYVLLDALLRGLGAGSTLAGGAAAAVLALGFSVMLSVFRDFTTLAFFGSGGSPRRVLARLAEQTEKTAKVGKTAQGDALAGIADALREIWHLAAVEISSATDGAQLGRAGTAGSTAVSHRLVAGGQAVGTIRCSSDDPAVLTNIVQPMLNQIGGLLAVTVQLAIANRDLASLRERTRGVSREERRLLHGELHDEIAPSLSGIGFAIAAARRLTSSGSPDATDVIERVRAEVHSTTERVRSLARALLPAALDAGDLDGALHELVARFSDPGFTVTIRAEGTDAVETDSQLSAYLVLADAIDILAKDERIRGVHVEVGLRGATLTASLAIETAGASQMDDNFDGQLDDPLVAISRHCAEAGAILELPDPAGPPHAPRVVIPL